MFDALVFLGFLWISNFISSLFDILEFHRQGGGFAISISYGDHLVWCSVFPWLALNFKIHLFKCMFCNLCLLWEDKRLILLCFLEQISILMMGFRNFFQSWRYRRSSIRCSESQNPSLPSYILQFLSVSKREALDNLEILIEISRESWATLSFF